MILFCSDELMHMSELNQDTEQSLVTRTDKLSTKRPDKEAVNMTSGTESSHNADIRTHSNLNKVLSRKSSTRKNTRKKKSSPGGRAPRRPLVCVPCKKHFSRRRTLDQHNRLEHNTEVTYSCSDCHMTFSRMDNIARHVKYGKCTVHSQQSATDAELFITSDDTQILGELSTFTYIIIFCLYLTI